VLPVMVGVMMSKWVGDAFGRDSVYTAMIRLKGYPYLDNKREHHFKERASDVMSYRDLQVLTTAGNTVESLEAKLAESTYQGFPVVTSLEEPLVVGYVATTTLQRVMQKCRENPKVGGSTRCYFSAVEGARERYIDLSAWLDKSPIQIRETTPLDKAIEMFRALGLRYLLVTRGGQLIGILKKKDILEHIEMYRKGMHRRDDGDMF